MRILAVAERHGLFEAQDGFVRKVVFLRAEGVREAFVDRGVVPGGEPERLEREFLARRQRHVAFRVDFFDDAAVIRRVGQNDDIPVVLRGRPYERNAADIDVVQQFFERRIAFRGLLERIEVADDHVDHRDRMTFGVLFVDGVPAAGENAAEDSGVERFDPSLHNVRELRQFADLGHGYPGLAYAGGGSGA